jgi:hypothetical protein
MPWARQQVKAYFPPQAMLNILLLLLGKIPHDRQTMFLQQHQLFRQPLYQQFSI